MWRRGQGFYKVTPISIVATQPGQPLWLPRLPFQRNCPVYQDRGQTLAWCKRGRHKSCPDGPTAPKRDFAKARY